MQRLSPDRALDPPLWTWFLVKPLSLPPPSLLPFPSPSRSRSLSLSIACHLGTWAFITASPTGVRMTAEAQSMCMCNFETVTGPGAAVAECIITCQCA